MATEVNEFSINKRLLKKTNKFHIKTKDKSLNK